MVIALGKLRTTALKDNDLKQEQGLDSYFQEHSRRIRTGGMYIHVYTLCVCTLRGVLLQELAQLCGGQRLMSDVFSGHPLSSFVRQGLSLNFELTRSPRLAGQ